MPIISCVLGAALITLDNEQRLRAPSAVTTWTPGELLANWPYA